MVTASPPALQTTRDRLIAAALELFAERGYNGTSVGDIEAAAGLSPRAGALYKHFASKEDVLTAALRHSTEVIHAADTTLLQSPLGNLRADLTLLCRWGLHVVGRDQQLMKILMKDGEHFPELRREFNERIVRKGQVLAATWLERRNRSVGGVLEDANATVTPLLNAIIYQRVGQTLFGEPPGGLDDDRFVAAWVEGAMGVLSSYGLDQEEVAT